MLKQGPKLFFLPISEIWKCKRPEGWAGGTNNPLTAKCIFLLSNLVAKLKQTVTEMHMNYICTLHWAIKLWKVTKQSESGDPNKKTKQRSPKIKVKYKIKDLPPTSSPSFFFLTFFNCSVQISAKWPQAFPSCCLLCLCENWILRTVGKYAPTWRKTRNCENLCRPTDRKTMHQHDREQEIGRIFKCIKSDGLTVSAYSYSTLSYPC